MSKVLAATKLEQETLNDLKKIATQKRRTISDLLRIIIEDYVQQQKI